MQLDEKTMRLIAVGASITANCQPCLEVNVAKAREEGIPEQDLAEAIAIGKMVRRGAESKMDKLALSLINTSSSSEITNETVCECIS